MAPGRVHSPRISPLADRSNHDGITALVIKLPLFHLTMAPKQKGNSAGNSDMPVKMQNSLSEKISIYRKKQYNLQFQASAGCPERTPFRQGGTTRVTIPATDYRLLRTNANTSLSGLIDSATTP